MKFNLDFREKVALSVGILALALVLALALYVPMGPRKWYLQSQRDLASAREDLKLQQLFKLEETERLNRQKALMEKTAGRPADFSLFAYLDALLAKTNLRNRAELEPYRIKEASQKQPMVQLRLREVSLEELVGFIYEVYSSGNLIAVYKMDYLRPAPAEKGLDCDITFVTLLV